MYTCPSKIINKNTKMNITLNEPITKKMLESRPEDALVKLVKLVELYRL